MNAGPELVKQQLIDAEICMRCNTCERRCPTGAISQERVYVVDAAKCTFCMACIAPLPTDATTQRLQVREVYTIC